MIGSYLNSSNKSQSVEVLIQHGDMKHETSEITELFMRVCFIFKQVCV